MWVTAAGYRLHVHEEGSGQKGAVLFLHGWPDSGKLWSQQAAAVAAAGWRAIVPDLLGYGDSDKPQEVQPYGLRKQAALVLQLMDQVGCQQFCVVGHDYGAALAWWVAMVAPSRVLKLIVISVGSPGSFFAAGGMAQRQRAWYQLFFLHRPEAEEGLQADDWALLRALLGEEPPEAVEQYIEALSQPGALTAALNWYRANTPPSAFAQMRPRQMPVVQCPTLGIWSSRDGALTEAQMKTSEIHVAPGKWQYVRIEGCSHWVPRSAAQELTGLLLRFLDEPGSPGGLHARL